MTPRKGNLMISRSLGGVVLRVVLVFALVASGTPSPLPAAPSTDAPTGYYFRNGRGIYHVDYSEMLSNATAVLEGSGEFTVTVKRARFFDECLTCDDSFVFGSAPLMHDVERLGFTEREVEESTAVDLRYVDRWSDVVTWRVVGSDDRVTTSFRVGADLVAMTLPRGFSVEEPGEATARDVALIEVNGALAEIDGTVLRDLAEVVQSGKPISEINVPASLEDVADRISDVPRLVTGVTGLGVAESRARVDGPLQLVPWGPAIGSRACEVECMTCLGTLVGAVGAGIGLILACGSALVTGGSTAIACVMAFLGYQATHVAVFASCAACGDCMGAPHPPPPTDPAPEECPCQGEEDCPCSPPEPGS
jgi:hypothetical protein